MYTLLLGYMFIIPARILDNGDGERERSFKVREEERDEVELCRGGNVLNSCIQCKFQSIMINIYI